MKISNKLVLLAIILFCILTGSCSPSGSIQPAFLQPGDSIGVMVISSPINVT